MQAVASAAHLAIKVAATKSVSWSDSMQVAANRKIKINRGRIKKMSFSVLQRY